MLTYTITGDTVVISEKIRAHIEKRFRGFERFMDEDVNHEIIVTVQKATAHARDDAFRVEAKMKLHERDFFAVGTAGDITAAADAAKEELMREVTHSNAKRRTLFHRGARKIKSMMRGGPKGK